MAVSGGVRMVDNSVKETWWRQDLTFLPLATGRARARNFKANTRKFPHSVLCSLVGNE